jgi:hypothetical protein
MKNPPRYQNYPDVTAHSLSRLRYFKMPLPRLSWQVYDSSQSSPRLRFFGMLVSAASIPSVSSDGTKLGLEHKNSKMTSGSVAARASARGQIPQGRSFSFGARIKGRKRFLYPKRSISCIQPPSHLAVSSGVGGTEEGAQFVKRI